MQAYEFKAIAQDGFIRIPDEYVKKVGPELRVILFPVDAKEIKAEQLGKHETSPASKRSLFPNFTVDTTGYVFNREEANER